MVVVEWRTEDIIGSQFHDSNRGLLRSIKHSFFPLTWSQSPPVSSGILDRIRDISKNIPKIKMWYAGESPRKHSDKIHTKRNSKLLPVKKWLLYCPLWDQKEYVISFIMYQGRGGKREEEKKQLYSISCSVKIYCILHPCNFPPDCKMHTYFDNTPANNTTKCIIFW